MTTIPPILIDTHTHTVLSGHAWSTLRENARSAHTRGLQALCLTEHAHTLPGAGPFFLVPAQKMLPPIIEEIKIFYGVEANITDLTGKLDVEDRMLFGSEWNIASMHDVCMRPGTKEENTLAFIRAIEHPAIDMLGHIDDAKTPNDFEKVIAKAAQLNKVIEINNNSLSIRKGSKERIMEIAKLCAQQKTKVAVSSDAHFDTMIGNVDPARNLLAEIDFPPDLIVNRDLDTFEKYLADRNRRLDAVRPTFLGTRRSARRMAQNGENPV